jgi:transposase
LPAGYVFCARLILMLAEGASFNTIKRRLQTSAPTIIRWKQRFLQSGLDGLDTYHPGQRAMVLTPALRARILSATRKKPGDGSTHWSCRKLATALGVSKDAVHRVWKEAGLKPHCLERYLASDVAEHTSTDVCETSKQRYSLGKTARRSPLRREASTALHPSLRRKGLKASEIRMS